MTLVALEHRMRASPAAEAYVRTLRLARYGGRHQVPTVAQRRAMRRELARGSGGCPAACAPRRGALPPAGTARARAAVGRTRRDRLRSAPPARAGP